MTKIESETVNVKSSSEKIYNFLADFNNFSKIMPEQIVDWEATSESCSFTIKGMASLSMKYSEKNPSSILKIVPNGKTPFDFVLNCILSDKGDSTDVKIVFDADLNMFLKMMAEKPLTNFVNLLVNKLKEINF
jgi:carbon monoxide dehydrogenase subunit G